MKEMIMPKMSNEEKVYDKYTDFLCNHGGELEKTNNWNKVFEVLDLLHMDPDYALADSRPKNSTNDVLSLYARFTSTTNPYRGEYLYYELVTLDYTPEAIWQAFLLQNTYHFIGMRWHGYYEERSFVFRDVTLESGEKLPVTPVKFSFGVHDEDDIKDYLEYCYWNEWVGLVRAKVEIKFDHNAHTVSFETVDEEVLYEYSCGYNF